MKKILFVLILICSFEVTIAQNWSVGPRLGLNLSTITNTDAKYMAGVNVGLWGEYKIRDFAIGVDLLYSSQGLKSDIYGSNKIDKYLLIPVKCKFYMPYILTGLNLFAGPQLELCLDRSSIQTFGGPSLDRNTLASIIVGVGYRFKCGLDLSMNYNVGLVSNLKTDNMNYMNSVFQIAVGWDLVSLFAK